MKLDAALEDVADRVIRPDVALALTAGRTSVIAQVLAPEITPARLNIEKFVPPGASFELPAALVVRNTGSENLSVRMDASTDEPSEAGWLEFDPSTFELEAGRTRVIGIHAEVPPGIPLGPRLFRLRASVRQDLDSSGVGLGFTAAVMITSSPDFHCAGVAT